MTKASFEPTQVGRCCPSIGTLQLIYFNVHFLGFHIIFAFSQQKMFPEMLNGFDSNCGFFGVGSNRSIIVPQQLRIICFSLLDRDLFLALVVSKKDVKINTATLRYAQGSKLIKRSFILILNILTKSCQVLKNSMMRIQCY